MSNVEPAESVRSLSQDGLETFSSVGHVTLAYRRLEKGDREAFTLIVEYFSPELVRRAGYVLPRHMRRAFGPSDAVQNALFSFWEAVVEGKFTNVRHREDIFRILAAIVFHKAMKLLKAELAKKRGDGKVKGESGMASGAVSGVVLGREPQPSPVEQAIFNESLGRLIEILPEKGDLRPVGEAWLRGIEGKDELTARDIKDALNLKVSDRTVQRKIKTILEIWGNKVPELAQFLGVLR